MVEVHIVMPKNGFGLSGEEHPVVTAMRIIGVGFGEDGDWCAKYGCNAETDIFRMTKFYWGDCTCDEDWAGNGHSAECGHSIPNFLYKPTGFSLNWYKYVGRDMELMSEAPLPADFLQRIFATHPKGMTFDSAVAETARQEHQTAESFAKMFADLGVKTS